MDDSPLPSFCDTLAVIAAGGEKCGPCEGKGWEWDTAPYGYGRHREKCTVCNGTGKIPPPDLIHTLTTHPALDWLEERNDVRRELVRPLFVADEVWTSRFRESVFGKPTFYQSREVFAWHWLPDARNNERDHLSPAEAARRLLLLFRKPCGRCIGSGGMTNKEAEWENCPRCSSLGYFPQTLIYDAEIVDVPRAVARDAQVHWWPGIAKWVSSTMDAAAHLRVEQWAANHLLRIPKEAVNPRSRT